MSMEIRQASNQDTADIRTVIFSILAEYGLMAEHEGVDADLADIEGNYMARGGSFDVVVDAENKIVGTVGLYPLDQQTCELRKMYLIPACRGKGIGKKLLDRALDKARLQGFLRIVLETSSKLVEAIAMYERYGFTRAEDFPTCLRCDQAYELTLVSS